MFSSLSVHIVCARVHVRNCVFSGQVRVAKSFADDLENEAETERMQQAAIQSSLAQHVSLCFPGSAHRSRGVSSQAQFPELLLSFLNTTFSFSCTVLAFLRHPMSVILFATKCICSTCPYRDSGSQFSLSRKSPSFILNPISKQAGTEDG